MSGVKVFDATILGHRVEVFVDDRGWFKASLGGAELSELSWRELEEKLQAALREAAVPVDVPFTSAGCTGVRHGKVVGKNPSGRLLIRWDGSSHDEIGACQLFGLHRRFSDEETEEALALYQAF